MANNYSSGTIETNFNTEQVDMFQRHAYAYWSLDVGEHKATFDALVAYDKGEAFLIFEQDQNCFWEMESFDYNVAHHAVSVVFRAYPDEPLTAEVSVAFYCDKPRMGEFGGMNDTFQNIDGELVIS